MNIRRIISNTKGAAAAEFAILMVPVIGLALVSLQTAIVFFVDQNLQTATKQAARTIMTGATQNASMSSAQFQKCVCSLASTFSCGGVMVDVESGSNFGNINDAALTPTYNAQGQVQNTWSFSPGGPGDVVIVRVMYDWPILGGALVPFLGNEPDGGRLLVATVVFKNEPYATASSTPTTTCA